MKAGEAQSTSRGRVPFFIRALSMKHPAMEPFALLDKEDKMQATFHLIIVAFKLSASQRSACHFDREVGGLGYSNQRFLQIY